MTNACESRAVELTECFVAANNFYRKKKLPVTAPLFVQEQEKLFHIDKVGNRGYHIRNQKSRQILEVLP